MYVGYEKWFRGGCLDFAEAILEVLGEGYLAAVQAGGETHHVLVQRGEDLFSDAAGDHSLAEVLAMWATQLRRPVALVCVSDDERELVGLEEDEERREEAVEEVESMAWTPT